MGRRDFRIVEVRYLRVLTPGQLAKNFANWPNLQPRRQRELLDLGAKLLREEARRRLREAFDPDTKVEVITEVDYDDAADPVSYACAVGSDGVEREDAAESGWVEFIRQEASLAWLAVKQQLLTQLAS